MFLVIMLNCYFYFVCFYGRKRSSLGRKICWWLERWLNQKCSWWSAVWLVQLKTFFQQLISKLIDNWSLGIQKLNAPKQDSSDTRILKGAFINDVIQIWTIFNPPAPSVKHLCPCRVVKKALLTPYPLIYEWPLRDWQTDTFSSLVAWLSQPYQFCPLLSCIQIRASIPNIQQPDNI